MIALPLFLIRTPLSVKGQSLLANHAFTLKGRSNASAKRIVNVRRVDSPGFCWLQSNSPGFWIENNFHPLPAQINRPIDANSFEYGKSITLSAFDNRGKIQGAIKFHIDFVVGQTPCIFIRSLSSAPQNLKGPHYNPSTALAEVGQCLMFSALQTFFSMYPDKTEEAVSFLIPDTREAKSFFINRIGFRPVTNTVFYSLSWESAMSFMRSFYIGHVAASPEEVRSPQHAFGV